MVARDLPMEVLLPTQFEGVFNGHLQRVTIGFFFLQTLFRPVNLLLHTIMDYLVVFFSKDCKVGRILCTFVVEKYTSATYHRYLCVSLSTFWTLYRVYRYDKNGIEVTEQGEENSKCSSLCSLIWVGNTKIK